MQMSGRTALSRYERRRCFLGQLAEPSYQGKGKGTEAMGVDGEENRSGQRLWRRGVVECKLSRRRRGREQRKTREKRKRVTWTSLVAFLSILFILIRVYRSFQIGPCRLSTSSNALSTIRAFTIRQRVTLPPLTMMPLSCLLLPIFLSAPAEI
jgi:hypothetical protein